MVSSWGRTVFLVVVLAASTISDSTQEQQLSLLLRRNVDTTPDEMKSLALESVPYGGDMLQSSTGMANEWSDAWTGSNDNSNVPSWRHFHAAATYTRDHEADVVKNDIEKMVIFGGVEVASGRLLSDTWLYYATISSWIRPTLDRQPGRRQSHTMTTLCKHLVVLFGGDDGTAFNDTWMFDGTTETWSELQPLITSGFMKPRTVHSALPMYQNLSPCRCKESVVIFGGAASKLHAGYHSSCYSDVWELRCVDDSIPERVYQWVCLQSNTNTSGFRPLTRTYPAVFPSSAMTSFYVWGGIECTELAKFPSVIYLYDFWRYNLVSRKWTLILRKIFTYLAGPGVPWPNPIEVPTVTVQTYGKDFGVVVAGRKTTVVDLVSGEITLPFLQRRDSVPNVETVGASAVMMGEQTVLFGGSQIYDGEIYPTVWNLSYSFFQWNWFANACPVSSPRGRVLRQDNVGRAGNSIYIFGGFVSEDPGLTLVNGGSRAYNDIWELDLLTSTWWHIWEKFAPKSLVLTASAVVNDEIMIFFGGSTDASIYGVVDPQAGHDDFKPLNTTWGYHTRLRRWTLYETSARPSARVCASLADVGNGSLILFGGLSNGQPLNDMWLLTLCKHDISMVSTTCGQWVQLNGNRNVSGLSPTWYPRARYYHSAVRVGNYMVVLGGSVIYDRCLNEMWLYSLTTGQWIMRSAPGSLTIPTLTCLRLMTSIGTKIVAIYQNWTVDTSVLLVGNVDGADGGIVYSYDMKSSSGWISQAGRPPFVVAAVVSWSRHVIALGPPDSQTNVKGRNRMLLSAVKPGCSAGQSSHLWSNISCSTCLVGTYANAGATQCISCPGVLTTAESGSSSLEDCICQRNHCHGHGTCYVIPYNSEMAPLCTCDTGYSGVQCQYPFLYIIVGATVASISVLVLICLLIFKCLQYRKGKLVVESELERMKKVWSIGSEEIHVEGHVAGGGFGDVSKARYREMTVAVKKLHQDLISFIEEERAFTREVELMQTIRHPNIVLFLGAGKYPDGCPFIVLEYVTNGTVRDVLDKDDVPISQARRIQFSLDAARGMMFLHSLTPPRMHRDLKSLNLLMTKDWVVKVADFGTSRVIDVTKSTGNVRRDLTVGRKGKQRIPKTEDLFDLDKYASQDLNAPLLSENIGTRQWQAPETIGHHTRYGLPADVFSFGMVMWEILTRKVPYDDRPDLFVHKLKADVMAGVRPQVPLNSPAAYVELMKDCWQTKPHRRPHFGEIVKRLTSMQDEHVT